MTLSEVADGAGLPSSNWGNVRLNGWLFYYQSMAFIQSGNWQDALGGNWPVLITADGDVRVLSLGKDVEEVAGPARFTP